MKLDDLKKLEKKYVVPTYSRIPVSFVKGNGVYLYDSKGNKYLDFFSGIAVNSLGYNNPFIQQALAKQSSKIWHTSNLYYIEPQILLAEKLSKLSNKGKVFFANSGAEANEAAIKLARLYGKTIDKKKTKILSLENSFHGRTLATITATGQKKYQKGFEPLPSGFQYVKINNVQDLKKKMSHETAAIFLEFLQGEGGINLLDTEFVNTIIDLAKKYKILIIADEVQSGLCRTGKWFAFKHFKIIPDIITSAKALGNGFPIGAMIAKKEISQLFSFGTHASTFGGNFLATAVANAVIDYMKTHKMDNYVATMGRYFIKKLNNLKKQFPNTILKVKGKGLMLGLQISPKIPVGKIIEKAREKGLLIGPAGNNVLRFLPPLIIEESHIDKAINLLSAILTENN